MINSKQRSFLRGLANTYDPIIQIGKGNVTPSVETAVSEALDARELIKIRVLRNTDSDIKTLAEDLAKAVRADVIQVIGRNFVLYRQNTEKPGIELP